MLPCPVAALAPIRLSVTRPRCFAPSPTEPHRISRRIHCTSERASRVVQLGAQLAGGASDDCERRRLISARVSEPASSQAPVLTSPARSKLPLHLPPPRPRPKRPSISPSADAIAPAISRDSTAIAISPPRLRLGSSDQPLNPLSSAASSPRGSSTTRRRKEHPPASNLDPSITTPSIVARSLSKIPAAQP
jgi:hypothetical protein